MNKRGGGGPVPRTSAQTSGADSSLSDADTQAKWPHDKYDEIQQQLNNTTTSGGSGQGGNNNA